LLTDHWTFTDIIDLPFTDIISVRRDLNLRSDFAIPAVKTENYGKNSVRYLGPLIWNMIPPFIKNTDNLLDFKRNIKKWKPEKCPCKLCKVYIHNLGFVNTIGVS